MPWGANAEMLKPGGTFYERRKANQELMDGDQVENEAALSSALNGPEEDVAAEKTSGEGTAVQVSRAGTLPLGGKKTKTLPRRAATIGAGTAAAAVIAAANAGSSACLIEAVYVFNPGSLTKSGSLSFRAEQFNAMLQAV